MAYAYDPSDPANMSPDERLAEVAAILAQGVLHLRKRVAFLAALGQDSPVKTFLESGPVRLDVFPHTSPDGPRG